MDQLTKMSSGISIAVKWVLARSHQMVNTAMSHARTPSGRVNSKSLPLTLLLGSLPPLFVCERGGRKGGK